MGRLDVACESRAGASKSSHSGLGCRAAAM